MLGKICVCVLIVFDVRIGAIKYPDDSPHEYFQGPARGNHEPLSMPYSSSAQHSYAPVQYSSSAQHSYAPVQYYQPLGYTPTSTPLYLAHNYGGKFANSQPVYYSMVQLNPGYGSLLEPRIGQSGYNTQQSGTQHSGYGTQQSGTQQSGYGTQQSGTQQSGYGTQQSGTQQSGYGTQQSGTQQSGYGTQQSGYGQQQSGYGQQQSRYGQRQSGYGQQRPGHGQQQSGYGQQQSGYSQQQSGYGQQQSTYDQRQSGYGTSDSKKEKVYVPVVIQRRKKKVKVISISKGFFIVGGTQLFGKFKTLKRCQKACAATPTCFAGDYNPWLKKCYIHSNFTACGMLRAHKKLTHFKKVPCDFPEAPMGRVMLGVQIFRGLEQKGITSLSDCIKKCASAGNGIPQMSVDLGKQLCFGIDYDFGSHKCYFHVDNDTPAFHFCPLDGSAPLVPRDAKPNPSVVSILLCPGPTAGK